jgi:hypothetical protein
VDVKVGAADGHADISSRAPVKPAGRSPVRPRRVRREADRSSGKHRERMSGPCGGRVRSV